MATEREIRLGRARLHIVTHPDSVILCDDRASAQRIAKALADAGAVSIDGTEAARGTVGDGVSRRTARERVDAMIAALQLPDDFLDWRPRDCSTLQRLLIGAFQWLLEAQGQLVIDTTQVAASPFDVAHVFAFVRRMRMACAADVVVIIADPAFISSAGAHLAVLAGDAVVEAGPVGDVLAQPQSEALLRRLEATPIANPLAMQGRRVQRLGTRPVNYAQTQVIALPTRESVALAGGDEEPTPA